MARMLPTGPQGQDIKAFPDCPVCGGTFEVVYNRLSQRVSVCKDCHTGLTIPSSAWDVLRLKREKKSHPEG